MAQRKVAPADSAVARGAPGLPRSQAGDLEERSGVPSRREGTEVRAWRWPPACLLRLCWPGGPLACGRLLITWPSLPCICLSLLSLIGTPAIRFRARWHSPGQSYLEVLT